jgi:hypothetical protein
MKVEFYAIPSKRSTDNLLKLPLILSITCLFNNFHLKISHFTKLIKNKASKTSMIPNKNLKKFKLKNNFKRY